MDGHEVQERMAAELGRYRLRTRRAGWSRFCDPSADGISGAAGWAHCGPEADARWTAWLRARSGRGPANVDALAAVLASPSDSGVAVIAGPWCGCCARVQLDPPNGRWRDASPWVAGRVAARLRRRYRVRAKASDVMAALPVAGKLRYDRLVAEALLEGEAEWALVSAGLEARHGVRRGPAWRRWMDALDSLGGPGRELMAGVARRVGVEVRG